MPGPFHSQVTLLRRVPLFTALPGAVLTALAAAAIERSYAHGEMIFLEGEPCAGLYVIAAGEIKIFKLSSQGREQVLHRLGVGGTFNEVAVLDGGPNPASAAAISDALCLVITRSEIRRLAESYPQLAWALIESLARGARHLVGMVEDLALLPVKARLAKLLLAEAGRPALSAVGGDAIDRSQMLTQADMAARLGTVREMVGRALRELVDDGLIAMDRHRILILDRVKLAAVAEGG